MTPRACLAIFCVLIGALAAHALEPVDLGDGLGYVRVRALERDIADLPAALNAGRALVVDLRYATADADAAGAFLRAVTARTTKQPLFVLVSPQAPADALPALLPAGVFTLGVADSRPQPAVVVTQPPIADRAAYDAAEKGAKLDDLISGKIEKERFDEASLVKEFQNGNHNAEPPPEPEPGKPTAAHTAPPVDRVLQRAVHLHRALLAWRPAAPARP
jgi:hypothetical protein